VAQTPEHLLRHCSR
jgi:hypothetical protein